MFFQGYGDSGTNVDMTEDGIISDSVQIYQWIRNITKNDIYLWGHSLGGALALHTVRNLKERNFVPMGVVIESSFSTMREEIKSTSIAKVCMRKNKLLFPSFGSSLFRSSLSEGLFLFVLFVTMGLNQVIHYCSKDHQDNENQTKQLYYNFNGKF